MYFFCKTAVNISKLNTIYNYLKKNKIFCYIGIFGVFKVINLVITYLGLFDKLKASL